MRCIRAFGAYTSFFTSKIALPCHILSEQGLFVDIDKPEFGFGRMYLELKILSVLVDLHV